MECTLVRTESKRDYQRKGLRSRTRLRILHLPMSPIRLRVKDYRERKGWTQEELAGKAGVRRATVSDYERGRERIDLATLEKLANALGVDAAMLIEHKKGKR